MAGRLCTVDVVLLLNNRFGAATATTTATHYVGLSTTTPNVDGTGFTEPVGGGYARSTYANNTTNWPTTTTRTKSNGVAIVFNTATANWGLITHFLLFDALTGGALRAYGPLAENVEVLSGQTRSFPVGSIVITAPSS